MSTTAPAAFTCPITQQLLEWPVLTMGGNTYEYAAISEWLDKHNTDPQTGLPLPSKTLVPNHAMRSQVQDYIQANPSVDRNPNVVRPPANSSAPVIEAKQEMKLADLCSFVRQTARLTKSQRAEYVPQSVTYKGYTYEFRRSADSADSPLQVRCKGYSEWLSLPERTSALFSTSLGVIFYNPNEMHDVFELKDKCRFERKCTNAQCPNDHPFACLFGVDCRNKEGKCKFLHPNADSVVPLGSAYPLSKACQFGTACSNKACHFAHPKGRVSPPRHRKQLFVTHSHELVKLSTPLSVELLLGDKRPSKFTFQGEFVFFFTPYSGAWAKERHFRTCTVVRYSAAQQAYARVCDYELGGHYCNAAVGLGRYLTLSWWPYEEEAMRTQWEGVNRENALAFDLQRTQADNAKMAEENKVLRDKQARANQVISKLKTKVKQQGRTIQKQQAQAAEAKQRQEAAKAKRQAQHEKRLRQKAMLQAQRQAEYEWRKQRQRDARRQNERFRLRDPIHVYALQAGCSGAQQEHWVQVLDYHKGAHALELAPDPNAEALLLKVTEHDQVFEFQLHAPAHLDKASWPVVPGRLCEGF